MEESINPSPVPSNCTSPVCSDPAHDDLALDSEWSDEDRDCVGDGPHRVVEESPSHEDPDVRVRDDEVREVRQDLLRLSGANAPEILKGVESLHASSPGGRVSPPVQSKSAKYVAEAPTTNAVSIIPIADEAPAAAYKWFSAKLLTRFKATFDGPVDKL